MASSFETSTLDGRSPDTNDGPVHPASGVDRLVLDDGSVLTELLLVRQVPGKRYVYRAQWQGQTVYAKVFVGKNNAYYANRDLKGVALLAAAEIETPPLLLHGQAQAGQMQVLVFLAISEAMNAEEAWCKLDDVQRFKLAQKLVATLARHHQAGLIQTDLYFKNFLVQDELIYTLDGDGIRPLSWIFRKRQTLTNLATLFSKMDVLDDQWIPELYAHYCRHLSITQTPEDKSAVLLLTSKIRSQMASAYADKKVFRTCTDVKVTKGFKFFLAVSRDFTWGATSAELLDLALADKGANLKNGNTCTIGKALIADMQVVVKRYNIKGFWHGLNRAFRTSRAAASWANAHRLLIADVATPKPLALFEERWGFLLRRAYYLSEYVDAPDALQFFASSQSAEDKETVARNLAILFCRLYLLKFSHGDCKATNIKIVKLAPVLIDLDGMQSHRFSCCSDWWFEKKHIRDLQRFMKNWSNDPDVTQLLKQALKQEYVARSGDHAEALLIRAGIA